MFHQHKAISILLSLFLTTVLYSQQFQTRNISWKEGLMSAEIYAIVRDEQGYIWIGGYEDLARYDGKSLVKYSQLSGWPVTKDVYDIKLDIKNNLWIISGDTCLFTVTGKNSGNPSFVMYQDIALPMCMKIANDVTWCVSENALFKIKNYQIVEKIIIPDSFNPYDISSIEIMNGSLFMGNESDGLLVYNISTKKFTSYSEKEGLLSNHVYSLSKIHDQILIGHQNGISVISDQKKINIYPTNEQYIRVNSIIEDQQKRLWVVSDNGVFVYQNKELTFSITDKNNDLNTTDYNLVYEDIEGNFWLGSRASGIYLITNTELKRYSNPKAIKNSVYGFAQDSSKQYWFAYYGNNFTSLQLKQDCIISRDTFPTSFDTKTMAYNPIDNSIWMAGKLGIASIKNGKTTTFQNEDIFKGASITSIAYNAYDTSIYIAHNKGVCRFKNGLFKKFIDPDTLSESYLAVRRIAFIKNKVYLGTIRGVKQLVNDTIKDIPGQNNSLEIWSISADKYGSIWYCDGGNNIIKMNSTAAYNFKYTNYDLLKLANIQGPFHLAISDKYFVLRSFKDLFIYNLESIYRNNPQLINSLNEHDGINPETPYFVEMNFDAANNLWLCSSFGAYKYNFLEHKKNNNETFNHINSIKINDELIETTKYYLTADSFDRLPLELKLPYNKNEISFDFIGICYTGPSEVKYKTRLLGLSDEWSNPFQDNHITYNNLSPGKYTFQFISCNNDGIWSKEPYSFSFKIKPPWYKTTWFRIVSALLLATLIYLIFLIRVNQLRKAKVQQENLTQAILQSQEDERKRIAQDLHDGVGQKLSMLKVKAEKENNEPMKEKVADIIEDIRFLSRNIHPHYFEKLGLTKAIEMLVEENKQLGKIYWIAELENIDTYFSTQQQLVIFRIIQECMNNILKHSKAKNAKITFEKNNHQVQVSLQDNGKGFNMDNTKLNSLGLSTIKERVRSLNGHLTIKTKPGQGTHTIIQIPLGKYRG